MESIFYIEQSIEEDRYYLYLRRPCSIAIGQDEIIFKKVESWRGDGRHQARI